MVAISGSLRQPQQTPPTPSTACPRALRQLTHGVTGSLNARHGEAA